MKGCERKEHWAMNVMIGFEISDVSDVFRTQGLGSALRGLFVGSFKFLMFAMQSPSHEHSGVGFTPKSLPIAKIPSAHSYESYHDIRTQSLHWQEGNSRGVDPCTPKTKENAVYYSPRFNGLCPSDSRTSKRHRSNS